MADPVGEIHSVLLDIEGTTTSIDFVDEVLFPYARRHVKRFLQRSHSDEDMIAEVDRLREEHAIDVQENRQPPDWSEETEETRLESAVAYVHWLIERDRKSTGLKSIQGKIWKDGYVTGELRGQVFEDVAPAFARWRRQNKSIGIFSSGSILAQKLLFANTEEGDLTLFIDAYFDTTTGPKKEPESYRKIAIVLQLNEGDILFLSDVVAELDAAKQAGMLTALCARPGNAQLFSADHRVIHSFDRILP